MFFIENIYKPLNFSWEPRQLLHVFVKDAMLTTLTAAVVLPTAGGNRFQFCVCNVGDSLAYVYSKVPE